MIDGRTEFLCILGNPVAHTKSPAMHNALFKALGINAVYLPLSPSKENFYPAIKGLCALHFRGANVTIPFKESAAKLGAELSPISKFTGSVNTLYWKENAEGKTLSATTTDPYGAIKSLENEHIDLKGKSVSLLGNGGASAAIAFALLEQGALPEIVCRNESRGKALAERLQNAPLENSNTKIPREAREIPVATFENFHSEKPDIIINTTPLGMEPNVCETPLPHAKFRKEQIVFDIIYAPKETLLLKAAKEAGCKTLNGENMLIFQGLSSFKLWFPNETKDISDKELAQIMQKALETASHD